MIFSEQLLIYASSLDYGNLAAITALAYLLPIILLGLLLLGRPAGQTAPERAAANGGWPAHRHGDEPSGNPSTKVRLWRPLHYG